MWGWDGRTFFAAATILLAGVPSGAYATCEDVYRDSVKDHVVYDNDWSALNTIFDRECTKTGSKSATSFDSSMGLMIDELPINMTGNGKTSDEKVSNFCKLYVGMRFDKSHLSVVTDTVRVEALDRFNTCKAAERDGIDISHKFADPAAIDVNFDFTKGTTVLNVDSVLSTNLECRANAVTPKTLDKFTHFSWKTNFAIACTRFGGNGKDGNIQYPPASLAIATNYGSYAISMPSDTLYNHQLASEAVAKINSLTATLSGVVDALGVANKEKADLSAFKDSVSRLRIEVHSVITGNPHPGGGGQLFGCGTSSAVMTASLCPNAKFSSVDLISGGAPGGQCGYNRFAVTCINF
jgi:hypothetical protein